MSNEINEVINNICEKLGTTIDKVMPEYAKYMVVTNIKDFIIGIILLVFTAILFRSLFKWLKSRIDKYKEEMDDDDWMDEDFAFAFYLGCAPLIITTIVGIIFTINGLKFLDWLISPQGAFVAYVLRSVKG